MKKLPKLRTLRLKAWALFSVYVRTLGANDRGFNRCYTCGRELHWKEMNAGHYRHDSHDFDERNVKAQCPGCNLYESGRSDEFYLHLVRDYGQAVADDLRTRKKWNGYSRQELNDIIEKYRCPTTKRSSTSRQNSRSSKPTRGDTST